MKGKSAIRLVIAPDSFKECMSAAQAAETMKEAVLDVIPDADIALLPAADGGEGTMEALVHGGSGRFYEKAVTGPLGEQVRARYGMLKDGKTAVVEMAQASGIQWVPRSLRNPLKTTTYGTGELIRAALDHDIERLIVTIGGSATNDAGAGMLQALGAKITDAEGSGIGFGGGCLRETAHVDLSGVDPRLASVELLIACDVTNPLAGPQGASRVFGPQKGASPEMVDRLEAGVKHFADRLESATGRPLHGASGAGAAGGTGAALMLCGGKLMSGIDLVLDVLHFEKYLSGADYVLTGEGKIDEQTPAGKVIAGITRRAKASGVPVIAFAGTVKPGYEPLYEAGLLSVCSIIPSPCTLEEALKNGVSNLHRAVQNTMRLLQRNHLGCWR